MILKQYYLGCLAHASYLIGDQATGTAVVVDPQRDTDQYLADAASAGLEIRHVFRRPLPPVLSLVVLLTLLPPGFSKLLTIIKRLGTKEKSSNNPVSARIR